MNYYLGISIITLLSLQLLLCLVSYMRRSYSTTNQFSLEKKLFEQKVDRLLGAIEQPVTKVDAWSGWRKFRVAKIVEENKTIKSFYLTPHDGKFFYSLSVRATDPQFYRVTIRKQTAPANVEGGEDGVSSSFFHDQVKKDAVLDIQAPSGKFYLDLAETSPVVMVAGGIGVTPSLSMLLTLSLQKSERDIWLFYAAHDEADVVRMEKLKRIERRMKNLRIHYFFSKIDKTRISSRRHHGRLSAKKLIELGAPLDADFYVCGPASMTTDVVDGLKVSGIDTNRVHYESFGPASVTKVKKQGAIELDGAESQAGKGFSIDFQRSNKTVTQADSSLTLLETAEAAGIEIDHACRAGSCGTCLTKVLDGEVEYADQAAIDIEAGFCLPCISMAKSNLKLGA